MTAPRPDAELPFARPPGSTIDLAFVHAVATETNRAQRSMGTQLLAIDRHGATVALPWRDDLADPSGAFAPGVLAALLDHACSLAALLSLDDPARFGTTVNLRVDYLAPVLPAQPVHVRGEAVHEGSQAMAIRGEAFHPHDPQRLLATAVCTVATA